MTTQELAVMLGTAQRHLEAAGQALNAIVASLNAEAVTPDASGCPKCGADEKRIRRAGMGGQLRAFCRGCGHEWSPEA